MSENASEKAKQFLEKSGVNILLNIKLLDYNGTTVILDRLPPINAKTLIWTAGVKGTVPSGILKGSISRGNRIKVNSFNQVEELQNVFAIGDVASLTDEKNPNGLPMVAQVAIQEGKLLAENIRRLLNKKQMIPFAYRDKGSMAIVSRNKAVADLYRFRFHGMFAWLIWTFVHLMSIVGFRNRLVVFVDWVWNYISYDRALRNIIRPYKEK
jgi:NADH:ubiquinone reductase (H+-translocating)